MALDIKDGTGAAKTLKTTLDGSDLVPHHIIDAPTLTDFRSLAVSSTAVAVKASAGSLYGFNIINLNVLDIYVKFYNIAAASVNPASDVPIKTLFVPANGVVYQEPGIVPLDVFSTAIAVRVVTGSGDTSTVVAATLPIIELKYS